MKAFYLTIALVTLSFTEARADSIFLLGAQGGQAKLDADFNGFNLDNSESSARVYAGWQFNQHLALLGGYRTFGDFEETIGNQTAKVKADGFTLGLQGQLLLSEKFTGVIELGSFFWDGNASINDVTSADPSDTNLMIGVGVHYSITDSFDLTADWQQYKLEDETARVVGFGIELKL